MGRKLKVVDLQTNTESIINNETNATDTEAQLDVKMEEQPSLEPIEPVEPVVMKKQRAPRKKTMKPIEEVSQEIEVIEEPKQPEPEVKPEPIPEPEVKQEPEEQKNIKTVELVKCEKCGKSLTARTLKYSHQSVCPMNENKPVKKTKKDVQFDNPIEQPPPRQLHEPPQEITAYAQRLNKIKEKQQKIKYLAAQAF